MELRIAILFQEPIIEQAQVARALLLTFLRVLFAKSDMHTLFDILITKTPDSVEDWQTNNALVTIF